MKKKKMNPFASRTDMVKNFFKKCYDLIGQKSQKSVPSHKHIHTLTYTHTHTNIFYTYIYATTS